MRATLETEYGSLRGEANGVMFTGYDAAAGDPLNVIASDANPNFDVTNGNLPVGVLPILDTTSDGHNAAYFIAFSPTITTGTFNLQLTDPYYAGAETTAGIAYTREHPNHREQHRQCDHRSELRLQGIRGAVRRPDLGTVRGPGRGRRADGDAVGLERHCRHTGGL